MYATNQSQRKYSYNGDPEITYKTDKTLKEGDEGYPNFCTLYVKSNSARNNITGVETWLLSLLRIMKQQ